MSGDIPELRSCDTLVALPPATKGCVIFGKNSDRPGHDVHEVIYQPVRTYGPGEKLQCTYIEIDQAASTRAVILSKTAWMWGAEMGANDAGVCIGNEAVWTKLNNDDDLTERLLGMDLVRLGLERGGSARESVDVITSLLAAHGQGGACADDAAHYWHSSFIIADATEAWVLETAGNFWAAERITEGVRNISNELSITTNFHLTSPNLIQEATSRGLYTPDDGPFNFAKVFTDTCTMFTLSSRCEQGRTLLEKLSANGNFDAQDMMAILRDQESGMNMGYDSKSSQVSCLPVPSAGATPVPCCHWLNATPDPAASLYKPFIFSPGASIGSLTVSPSFGDEDPRLVKPRFQRTVNREHKLYTSHQKLLDWLKYNEVKGHAVLQNVKELEYNCINDVEDILKNWDKESFAEVSHLFEHMCDIEINFYK